MEQTYHVGIYARLSRDDDRQGESVSIENQRLMLQRHCALQGWEVVETFVDDGWSGTNFDRPAFRRLMEAVRQKRVDLVLVKDLSRLGRDYIQVGKYTDCIFPYYGCRFVALNDGVDTLRQNDDVTMIFKNVINDIYARDTSKKIRAVRRANAESGKFMGYKAPYGYVKSAEEKHRLAIDPATAEVVRRIFALRKNGAGFQTIADQLNEERILPPRDYFLVSKGEAPAGGAWSRETVRAILKNEAYIGNLVQLKQGSLSYKDHRQRQRPAETWARVEGTHTPIIDRETWQAVRTLDTGGRRPRSAASLFSGLLYCKNCGKAMKRIVNRKMRGGVEREYVYYLCRGDPGHSCCISEPVLQEAVQRELRSHSDRESAGKGTPLEYRRRPLEKRQREVAGFIRRLYEDRAKGALARETYERLMEGYEEELRQLETRLNRLDQEKEVTRELLWNLAERIEVGAHHEVCIRYRTGEGTAVFP